MQFALNADGIPIEASRGVPAVCPLCGEPVIAKCGRIIVHHWAHHKSQDCDSWFEPETPWHRGWKSLFPPSQVEVAMGPHRADIRNASGLVVELQNSIISATDIAARESFYGRMVWLINGATCRDRFFIHKHYGRNTIAFKWKHMPKCWQGSQRVRFLDFGEEPISTLISGSRIQSGDFFDEEGRYRAYSHTQVFRPTLDMPVGRHRSLVGLPPELKEGTILRIRTLHDTGFGSGEIMSRADLCRLIGARNEASPAR